MGTPQSVTSKPTGGALTLPTIRVEEYRNISVDRIMKIGMFK